MNIDNLIPLLTAFGLGSIITSLTQSLIKHRQWIETRNFKERKEAYIGLLDAYHSAAVKGTDIAAKNFAYWQMRCELVAPIQVCEAITKIINSNDDKVERYKAHNELKEAMREDLDVSTENNNTLFKRLK